MIYDNGVRALSPEFFLFSLFIFSFSYVTLHKKEEILSFKMIYNSIQLDIFNPPI